MSSREGKSSPLVHQSPEFHCQGSRCCRPLFCASNRCARKSEHLKLTLLPPCPPTGTWNLHPPAAYPLWTSDWNIPSIQGTQCMWEVPPPAEDGLDQQPILWECGAPHHLISIGPGDSVTDLRHKLLNGLTGHPEGILQSGVAVTSVT